MKPGPFILAACLTLPFGLLAVEPGDTREAVIAELGPPSGTAEVGSSSILFYPRGEVKLRDGRVVSASLITDEALAARAAAEAESLRRMDEAAQARLARLEAEGRAVYAAKKSDARFVTLPAAEQLAFWRTFATRYPMVPIKDEVDALADRVNLELRLREMEAANEARIAQLEARLAATENQAARAELEAQRNRYRSAAYPYGRYHPRRSNYDRDDDNRPRPRPDPDRPRTTPPQNPVDADRARAMADAEEARRRVYTGGQ